MVHFYFFFFKQKTAYEMRISDWSSDVCSSDLEGHGHGRHVGWLDGGYGPFGRRYGRHAHAGERPFLSSRTCQDGPLYARGGKRRGGGHGSWIGRRHAAQPARLQFRAAGQAGSPRPDEDRKSGVQGKSVSVRVYIGGRRILKKKKQ